MIPSPLMGEDQDEGENLGCRSKIDALRQRLRKVEEPPHLNPLPPGERKERKMGEGEDKGENPRFDMPWHVATLNKDRAQEIVAPTLFNSFVKA